MDMPLYTTYLGEIMETGIYRVAGFVQWNLTHVTTWITLSDTHILYTYTLLVQCQHIYYWETVTLSQSLRGILDIF